MKFATPIILFFSTCCVAQKPEVIAGYINSYQQYAIAEQVRTGIPAAITMAQAIHESGAGQGELALKSNNHFGIKCKATWTGDKVYHDDDESGECFRAYSCVADSYRDHSDFIKSGKRYGFLFSLDPQDYAGWASGLKQAGYATNPKYPQILIRLIEENELENLTETAMKQSENGDVWLAATTTKAPAINAAVIEETPKKAVVTKNIPAKKEPVNAEAQGIFKINHCRVLFAEAGTSLKKIATQHGVSVGTLLDYNDMKPVDKLASNQLIFLEKKRKKGGGKIHEVQKGETTWLISQQEGMQLARLIEYNRLTPGSKLKAGQLLYLKGHAPK
jgi:hypothetical protein